MIETIRLTAQAIAAGIGWFCLSVYATVPVIWYLRQNPDIDPVTIVQWSTIGYAALLGALYEGIELRWGKGWRPGMPRLHLGGALYALGGGIDFYNGMPFMLQAMWYEGGKVNFWTMVWVMAGMVVLMAGALFWTFQPAPEEKREEAMT